MLRILKALIPPTYAETFAWIALAAIAVVGQLAL